MTALTELISAGGGGSEVNDTKYIHSSANIITTESGEKWQKTGYAGNLDTTTYPNAGTHSGSIGTTTDTEVSLAGTSSNWSAVWSSTITTNGTWVWNGGMGSSVGNNEIFARKLDGTGSVVAASDSANFTSMNGKLIVHADLDGFLYSFWAHSYANSFQNRYHSILKHSINSSTGVLTDQGYVVGSLDLGPYWLDVVCRNHNYGTNYWLFLATDSSGGHRAWAASKSNGALTVVKTWASSLNTVEIPTNLFSMHEFNGYLWIKGSDNYLYKYTLGLAFVEKVDVGTGNNFFSKTDSTGSSVQDSYSSMASSASGVHNFQRLYEATSNGYKNHPPATVVGTATAVGSGGINQYMRIL
jgi:hypothetical protein